MANKKNSTRVCDSIIAQVFLLAIGSRIQHDIHPQGGWSRTNRYYKTVTPCILLIPPVVDDKNHGFCAKHHMLLLNLVLDTYCNCTICCIPEFKRWPMQSVIAFFSLSWKTLVWTVLPPLAPSSSRMIVNGDGTIITVLWHSFEEICYLQLRGGTRRRRERERERKRERHNHCCHHASSLLTTYSCVRNLMKSCAFLGCEAKSSAWFASSKSSNWKAGAHVQPTNEKWCSGSRDVAFNNGPEFPSSSWEGMCKMSLVGYAPNHSMGFISYWGVWPAAKSDPNTVCFMLPSLSSSNTCHKTATYHHHVCFHTKVTMIQNLQSNTMNSITHVEIQQLKKKRIAFMGCEDQKEKDNITKILMEKKPWFIGAYNWRKRESHSWEVKTKKKERQRAQKSWWKKKEKSHDSSSKPTTGYFHFPKKNRLKLVVEKAHGDWIPKETYCQGFTGIEMPYFSTRDAMKTWHSTCWQ